MGHNMKNTGISRSTTACWIALACLVVPMFASYFFDDMFSTLSHIFQNPAMLELGWDSGDYGFYAGGYSFLCVCGGLVVCGVLLDIFGVRLVGSIFVGLMVLGALTVFTALVSGFAPETSLTIAYIGCMVFGLGSEIAGVAVTRSIAKWFKGRNVALAMGLQLALARLGTAAALVTVPRIVNLEGYIPFSETSRPAHLGLILIMTGLILWALFIAIDYRAGRKGPDKGKDKGPAAEEKTGGTEDRFRFSDVWKIIGNRHFILISLLCVTFYCCVISFRKFATAILIPRFGIESDIASLMVAMIPFFTLVFAPLFGAVVDMVGKGTKIMILGSAMILLSHLMVAFAPGIPAFGFIAISILGLGYSLVPAAMWPSLPKIIPESKLGTAFSLVYWIQNIGLFFTPIIVGKIIENTAEPAMAEYFFIALALCAIAISCILSRSSDRHPELCLDKKAKSKG